MERREAKLARCTTLWCLERKTEVYSWRVSTATKARLEDAARNQHRTVARLLDEMVTESLVARALAESRDRLEMRIQRRGTGPRDRVSWTSVLRGVGPIPSVLSSSEERAHDERDDSEKS